jgi:hypothetical protein
VLNQDFKEFIQSFAVVMAGFSIPVIPKYWVGLAIAGFSFACAAHYAWVRKPKSVSQEFTPHPLVFVGFGSVAALLAVGLWIAPPPAASLAQWLGTLSGVLLGGAIVAIAHQKQKRA